MLCSHNDTWHLKVMHGGIAISFSTGQKMVPLGGEVVCMGSALTRV